MSEKKRVIFTFDERSLENLQELKESTRSSSLANAMRGSIQVSRALQQQKQQGYTEVIVRNPETKEERVLIMPDL